MNGHRVKLSLGMLLAASLSLLLLSPTPSWASNRYGLPPHGDDARCEALAMDWYRTVHRPSLSLPETGGSLDDWGRLVGGSSSISATGGIDGFANSGQWWLESNEACRAWVRQRLEATAPAPPSLPPSASQEHNETSTSAPEAEDDEQDGAEGDNEAFPETAPSSPVAHDALGSLVSETRDPKAADEQEAPSASVPAGTDGKVHPKATKSRADQPFNAYLPLPKGSYRVGSKFGPRFSQREQRTKQHNGQDLPAPEGTPILAAGDGEVTVCESRGTGGYGNYLKVRHEGGTETVYAHILAGSIRVKKGDRVRAGQQVAGVGNTGRSDCNHLHFEVRPGPSGKGYVDPRKYFDF